MNNLDLEKALVSAVAREREAAALVLRLLREVEKRELYLERGYSSLFAYCRGHLGYSEPEAMLRIQAMRLMRRVPEVEKKIEKGELSMSVASLVQTKTKELEKEAAKEIVREVEGKSKREAERTLAGFFPEEPRKEKTRAVTEELTEIRFTVNKEEFELLQKLLDRKSHSNFQRSYKELFLQLVKKEIQKFQGKQEKDTPLQCPELAQRNDQVSSHAHQTRHPNQTHHSRHIPQRTRKQIWHRDEARCQYQDPLTKHQCQETHGLQIDHIQPYAQGGSHKPENLRLLCGAHNRYRNSS